MMAGEIISLQIVLLVLILFSWGLLFLSIAVPGQHAFKKDLKRIRLAERSLNEQSRKEKLEQINKKSCADCWSVMRTSSYPPPGKINDTARWNDADTLYLFTLKSALTSIRIRLRMAQKVAGKQKRNIDELITKVENLHERLEKLFGIKIGLSTFKSKSLQSKNSVNNSFDELLTINEDLGLFESSNSSLSSVSVVPSNHISVIADGRDCDIDLLLKTKADLYPNFVFHVAINLTTSLDVDFTSEKNIYIHEITKNISSGAVYNMLMKHVKTSYTFVAVGLHYFQENIRFNKLIEMLRSSNVWAVGGSILTSEDEWQNGCLQSSFKNFRLKYYKKNIAWLNNCLLCSLLEGPFLAATPMLKTLKWNELLPRKISTADLFLRAFHFHNFMAASCLNLIFPMFNNSQKFSRESIISFANLYKLKEVHFPHSQPVILKCHETNEDICRDTGEMVTPCCLSELASMIKFFLGTCEAHRLICELQEGSLLGAVKFGNVLPWEKDADITFHTANFTALQELVPVFANAGYTLKLTDNRWCCVNGSEAGGEGKLISDHWIAELYSQHAMDSEELTQQKLQTTKIELDGSWVNGPEMPGEFVRNRYGKNIYRHSEHWTELGKLSGWEQYNPAHFNPCGMEAQHSCLDQNPADGLIYFQLPCI